MEIGYAGLAAVVIAAGAIFWFISTINRFARMSVKITESDSGVDVALTKRYDTLTKMLDVTKAYARHEAETLAAIVKLRAGMSVGEKAEANRRMDEVTGRINVLAESYPELKSSENFRQLQVAISEAEEHLQAARRIYNMNVSRFNQLLASWPASVVGNTRRLEPKEFFKAEDLKKSDVKMEF
jgi:LemA protein